MLSLATPLIIIHMAITGMQFVDAYIVARLGVDALAAVLPAGMAFFVVLSFGWGFFAVVNTFISQSLGKGELSGPGKYAWNAIWIAFAYGGIMLLPSWLIAEPFFSLMDHETLVQQYEVTYFRINLFGAIPNLLLLAVSNFFTGIHKTKYLLISAISGSLLNVLFTFVLVFGIWIFPEMGVAGSAWGTVGAVSCQCVILFALFWSKHIRETYNTLRPSFSWDIIKQLIRVGGPGGFQGMWDLFTWGVIFTWMIGTFGKVPLAANTIVLRFMHFSFMPAIALAIILTASVGKSIGEGNHEKANKQTYLIFKVIMSYMVSIGLCFFLFRDALILSFTDNPDVLVAGRYMFLFAAIFQIFDSMFITFTHALRGAGDTKWQAMVLMLLSTFILCGGSYFMIKAFPELGAQGPWFACVVYVSSLGISMAIRWVRGPWRKINIFN